MNNKQTSKRIAASLLALCVLAAVPAVGGAQIVYSGYNAVPVWGKTGNPTVIQGQTFSTTIVATDDNGDPLTYSSIQLPAGATFNPVTRAFSFTPSFTQLGSFPVTLAVTDGKSTPIYNTFYVNVTTDYGHYVYGGGDAYGYYNQAPYFSTTNSYYTASAGSNLHFTVTAIDPEGQPVRYSVNGLPAGASFDPGTRVFSWTPVAGQRGSYTINFYANDNVSTSVPLTVSIVVDGGAIVYSGASSYYPSQPAYATPVSNYQYSYVGSYQNINANTCQGSTAPTTAIAGQTYVYLAHACGAQGLGFTYTLAVAPNGANINAQTGLVTWNVPSNAVNQSYQFLILATNGYNATPMRESFSVYVTGGTPTINTVTTRPTTVVRYIETPTSYATAPAYANQTVVSVNAGRVVPPTNYQYYGGSAYGAMLPAANVSISTFNIAVRATTNNEMAVSWDTNKPTSGEVVFGYSSQSRGPDLDRTILNYDFTTGEIGGSNTRHEASLGKLEASRTYYLRIISRADNQTDISREIVFIPMPNEEGRIIVQQSEGAASAVAALGNFLTSGGFLFFLLLVAIGLIAYLIVLNRRPAYAGEGEDLHDAEPHLHIAPEKHR